MLVLGTLNVSCRDLVHDEGVDLTHLVFSGDNCTATVKNALETLGGPSGRGCAIVSAP